MTSEQWRYIPPFSAPGEVQLALDHWLLDQCARGQHPPTLRFYTWHPTTISLGYFQRTWPQHWSALTWNDRPVPLVRRPTGGRAVLHDCDLTYAVIASDLNSNRRQAYQALCSFLIEGWKSLGVSLQYGQGGRGYHQQSNCFQVSTSADLVRQDGTKFIGSAQCWRGTTVLQHGSMQLLTNHSLRKLVFGSPLVPFSTDCASTSMSFQPMPSLTQIISTLKKSAEDCLKISCQLKPLHQKEWEALVPYMASTQV